MSGIYTLGYNGWNPPLRREDILPLVEAAGEVNPSPLVVDVRRSRGARINQAFDLRSAGNRPKAVEQALIPGCRYAWAEELGNQSHTLPWVRHPDADKNIAYLASVVAQTGDTIYRGPLVLLCAEKDHRRCHRTEVAAAIQDEVERLTGSRPEVRHL